MPQQATLVLSKAGSQSLGRRIFKLARSVNRVPGLLLSYDTEGVWFQDVGLMRINKAALVKWNFIDTILSDISFPEAVVRREIGFR
jgi:hypothetical protein